MKVNMTYEEQVNFIESKLKHSPNDWQLKVLSLILEIPSGHLISYGNLARWTNQEFCLQIGPRNTSWLRKRIYHILGSQSGFDVAHETNIPLHRIANDGDLKSTKDHEYTQEVNHRRRSAEGSRFNPIWIIK